MLGEIWKIGDWSVFPAENTLRRDGSEVKVTEGGLRWELALRLG